MELPVEIYHLIAAYSEPAYKALLAIPAFARAIDVNTKYDYMIHFGHSVDISHDRIRWHRNGKLHRLDGPSTELSFQKSWRTDGYLHRDGGPAVEYSDGYRAWYQYGMRHRADGPAVIYANGSSEYWANGVKL